MMRAGIIADRQMRSAKYKHALAGHGPDSLIEADARTEIYSNIQQPSGEARLAGYVAVHDARLVSRATLRTFDEACLASAPA